MTTVSLYQNAKGIPEYLEVGESGHVGRGRTNIL